MSTNKTFNKVQLDVKFTQATTRANLISEENISISFGKISKYFADLHSQAFTGYTHPTYTARTGKPTGNQTPGFGSTFTISQITSDGTGHVTAATDRTVKIPDTTMGAASADAAGSKGLVPAPAAGKQTSFLRGDGTWAVPTNTDTKVTQSQTTTTNYRPILFGANNSTDVSTLANTITDEAYISTKMYAQPSTGTIFASLFNGVIYKSGGTWIAARDHAPVYANKTASTAGSYYPAFFAKSKTGGWSMGVLGNSDTLYATFTTDQNYSANPQSNTNTYQIAFPSKNGTIALTSDIPTIPTVNNASLTLKGAGTTVTTFTANSSTNQSLDIVAGSNVTITPDATNHKITIASSYTNTDTKVKVTANTTTKGYLIASTTSPNGTAVEGIADTGVYLGTTAGSLYATSFYENGTSLASKYAAAGHKHTTTIAADSGTNQLTLAASTKYKLTAGETNFIFTTPPNTTYSANNGVGLSGTTFYNSGVRAVSTGSANGTISVNTNGSTGDVAVKGLASAAYVTQESLLRARSTVSTDGGATGWSQIGINQYNNAFPDGVTNKIYGWGAVVSMPAPNARFDLYYNHNSSTAGAVTNGLQYRTGWDNDKKAWRMLLDNDNYGSYMTYTSNRAGYASSDTHILQLGYFVTDGLYDNCTILVSSAFWGNQHGSSDIINYQQSNNTNDTAAIHVTMSRIRIGGSVGRTFYYKADNTNNRVYLYVSVTGGNSYGRWNTTVLQSSGLTTYWRPSMSENQANSGLTEITYTGRVDYATTATASYVVGRNTSAGLTTTGIQYAVGQLTIGSADGNAKEGSNASYKLWSYPAGGTAVSSTLANIQNLRLYWSSAYYRDIFISPNNYDIYHRAVENNNARDWRKILDSGNYTSYALASTTKYAASSSVGGAALSVSTAGGDVVLGTPSSSSNDSGDIYWKYGNGQEKARLWQDDTYTAKAGPTYRIYKSDGTALYNGRLPLADGTSASGTWGISITGNAATATTATNTNVTVTDVPSTSTATSDSWYKSYGLVFAQNPNTTQANTLRKSHNLRFYHGPNGTADTVGIGELIVGNNTASGTAGNMQGRLILYSSSSSYISMVPTATSSSVILTLPAVTGTVPSFTATPTSGQVVITDGTGGGIKSSGYTIAKSVPSNAEFTDANVLQSETTASQYRPIVFGATYSTDASALAATITGQTYVSTLLYAQPQNGILYANRMYLKAAGAKGQLNLITSKYNVMLRNDDSNTYFLVTAQNDPTGTWTSARPLTINNSTGVCSINGNAASANALNLTHGNELNFSKLASNGHVWFGYRWNTGGTETSGGTTITTYKFGNANGAGGLAGLEATTSTFKSGNFGDQLIVERTGGPNMAGITFKNTSGVLGYIAANTVDGDLYHYGATDTSTMQYTILDSHNYTSYPLPRNIKHIHTASGTEGTAGWVKIARITVTNAYANHPMTFTIAQRGIMQYRIHLVLVNNGSVAAAAISQFIIARDNSWTDTNNNPRAYIIKPSDGIFDLYIRKTEGYDHIFVVDFTKADHSEGDNYSVAWTNVHAADSAITGGTEAVKKLYLPSTTNYAGSSSVGGAATSANKLNTNAGAGDRPVYFSGGVPVQCAAPASGSWWKGVPLIGTDGVTEIGRMIDFHSTNTSTADYDLRLQYTGSATGKTVTLPGASGYVALLTKGSTSYYGMMDGDGSTSGWIRATSNGFLPSAGAKFFQTATSSLGTNSWYFKNSYIQYMNANSLVLGAAKTVDGAAKGQVKFFSGNGSDATGTVTLECVNDAVHTGDYTVKLPT